MTAKILDILYSNSKATEEDIAVMLGMDKEDVHNEIKAMEKEGIICGYTTMINWDKVDAEKVSAIIEVKVSPQRGRGFDSIAERIYRFDE